MNTLSVLIFDFCVATHLLLGTGIDALKTPAFHKNILDPVDSKQFTLWSLQPTTCISIRIFFYYSAVSVPWVACSGRHESPQDWRSARGGGLHTRTFWNRGKERCLRCTNWVQWGQKQVEVVPAFEACRDADVVIQDEMLHQLTETNSSSMRADWNWEGKV